MDYTWALNQTAVYWQRLGPDGYGGWLWEDPVEIDCRWVERRKLYRNAAGEEKVSKADVLLNQDVAEGDYLYLGTLDDDDVSASGATPANIRKAYVVQGFNKTPDLLAESYVRRAYL